MSRRKYDFISELPGKGWLLLTAILTSTSLTTAAPVLDTMEVASGLSAPVFVTHAPDDTTRLFIIEQPGRIRVVHNGALLATAYLDITSKVLYGGERGLLGLAFHPDYASNGYFYVDYTRAGDGATVVARYQVSSDSNVALAASESFFLTQNQPNANHNGGWIGFGPNDGYLYIGFGDGGGSGDPDDNGQDSTTWLGKILRIDVDGGSPYAVPPDNPYVGVAGWQPEIWALGVRNPWRMSFDRVTGDLWIGEVGQNLWEEIDFQAAASGGGENYGWRYKEGDHCYNPSTGCETLATMVDPIHEYQHNFSGGLSRCSITGGYIYRGGAITGLQGAYFFADYCGGEIWSFTYDGISISDSTDHTDQLNPDSSTITSFGEDAAGELYYCAFSAGKVVKIIAATTAGCCTGIRGNVNGDAQESIDIADVTYLVAYAFKGGPAPPCPEEGNVDGIGSIDIADVTYLVSFSFKGGPEPPACP
jgi:glucose/arabinose dehydrogenase